MEDFIGKRRALLAFAASQATHSKEHDEFSIIFPIFKSISVELNHRQLDTEAISILLSDRFGIEVTPEMIEYWVPRLLSENIIRKSMSIDETSGTIYCWTAEQSDPIDASVFEDKLSKLVSHYKEFSCENGDLFNSAADDERAIDIIFNGTINQLMATDEDLSNSRSEENYYFSRFVQYLETAGPESISFLSYLQMCAVTADLVFHMWQPQKRKPNLARLVCYLDSPIVMDLIGLGGELKKQRACKIMEMLKQLNARIYFSDFYVSEIHENIDGLLKAPSRERRGSTADALKSGEITERVVKLIQSGLRQIIEDAGIIIDEDTRKRVEKSLVDDEEHSVLFNRLNAHYTQATQKAINRDIDSYRITMSRRSTNRTKKLEDAWSIFITGNPVLSKISLEYLQSRHGYTFGDVPAVINIRPLAIMLASYFGLEKTKEISLHELLTSASTAVSADPEVFKRLEATLKDLRPNEADTIIELLRSQEYSQLISDVTAGKASNLTDEKAEQILETVKKNFEIEAREEVRKKFQASNKRVARERDEAQAKLEEEKKRARSTKFNHFCKLFSEVRKVRKTERKAEVEAKMFWAFLASFFGVAVFVSVKYSSQITGGIGTAVAFVVFVSFVFGFVERDKFLDFWIKFRSKKFKQQFNDKLDLLGLQLPALGSLDMRLIWHSNMPSEREKTNNQPKKELQASLSLDDVR